VMCQDMSLTLSALGAVTSVEQESAVNRSLSAQDKAELTSLKGWKGLDNPWLPMADSDVEYSYINLLVNPERYTGYMVRVSECQLGHHCSILLFVHQSTLRPVVVKALE
jgi:Endoplasmic Reticulum Oxidoreductin 1 (ERO1)